MGDAFSMTLGGAAMGALKKPKAPKTPDYLGAALSTSNASRYSEDTPYGSVGWSLRPGADPRNPQLGDYIRTTSLSPDQQGLFSRQIQNQMGAGGAAAGQLESIQGGQKAVADALYGRQTQYLSDTFGDQTNALRTRLINQGLTEGSEAYDKEMRNLGRTQNDAYTTAAYNATLGADTAETNAVNRFLSLLGSSQATVPTSANLGEGPDFLGAIQQRYGADMDKYNAKMASRSQDMQMLGNMASLGLMAFSDQRLKANITPAGLGPTGLPAYTYDIFGRRERGYLAQEVLQTNPDAVYLHPSGYLMLDYAALGGRP